jgi:hypothetical protein
VHAGTAAVEDETLDPLVDRASDGLLATLATARIRRAFLVAKPDPRLSLSRLAGRVQDFAERE